MKTTLVIMAAGLGARYGQGVKQLTKMGPGGEIIMDYSIYDAKQAGFDEVVFIIRKDIEADFKSVIGDRISRYIDVKYVFQDLNDLPGIHTCPKERKKPWGTGQAVLCAKAYLNNPFVVINADDYYGKEAFIKLHDFLINGQKSDKPYTMAMAGFVLKNTLSEHGTVTRGICGTDDDMLKEIHETKGVCMKDDKIICDDPEVSKWVNKDSYVSMNMWACQPEFVDYLENDFDEFLSNDEDPLTKEYLLPNIVESLLEKDLASVKILETKDKWFGVTYVEDTKLVQDAFSQLVKDGVYPKQLWK